MQDNLVLKLQVYYGEKKYNVRGEVISKKQIIKITYGTNEWKQFAQNAPKIGITSIDVEEVRKGRIEGGKMVYDSDSIIETPKQITIEVEDIFTIPEEYLTPEQREIKELRSLIEEMKSSNSKPKKESKKQVDPNLESARARYEELFGKKPSHLKKAATLLKEIEEKENE